MRIFSDIICNNFDKLLLITVLVILYAKMPNICVKWENVLFVLFYIELNNWISKLIYHIQIHLKISFARPAGHCPHWKCYYFITLQSSFIWALSANYPCDLSFDLCADLILEPTVNALLFLVDHPYPIRHWVWQELRNFGCFFSSNTLNSSLSHALLTAD